MALKLTEGNIQLAYIEMERDVIYTIEDNEPLVYANRVPFPFEKGAALLERPILAVSRGL